MNPPHEPIYLAGPTGSGKTAVALALARLAPPVEIVNADAFQAYSGMEVVSAAPSPGERRVCPHHLFGILAPSEENDAAAFAERAKAAIAEIAPRALPLVVGGSGLYLKAITHGLAPLPKGDPVLRSELETLSLDDLVARYRALDPVGAERTHLKNRRYVTRNLEITLLTGRPASELKTEWAQSAPAIRAVYLQRDRADLADRIERRTDLMMRDHVVAEVSLLGPLSATAARAIGLREIRLHLDAVLTLRETADQIAQATRRYAKRQETWFKREAEFLKLPVARNEEAGEIADRIARHFGLIS